MSNGDDFETSEPADSSGENHEAGEISRGESDLLDDEPAYSGSIEFVVIEVYWAKLRLDYTWNENGTEIKVNTKKYSAGHQRDRNKGNVMFKMISTDIVPEYTELTNDDAIQDGKWHELEKEIKVTGNSNWATLYFLYIYDIGGNDPKLYAQQNVYYAPPPPAITSPVAYSLVEQLRPVFAGLGVKGATVYVYKQPGGERLGSAQVDSGGRWTVTSTIDLAQGFVECRAVQALHGRTSDRWAYGYYTVLIAPLIQIPARNSELHVTKPVVSGTGCPLARVMIYRSGDGSVIYGTADVGRDGRWSTTLSVDLPLGAFIFIARQSFGGKDSKWSEEVPVTVLGAPVITAPAASSQQNRTFELTGNGGGTGAKIEVFIDIQDTKVGEGTAVAGGTWTAPVTLTEAGIINLVARQLVSGVPSDRSIARTFKIKPPKLTNIQVQYPRPSEVTFSGAGYNDATVDIHIRNNNTAQVSGAVSGGRWSMNWPGRHPQTINMNARQRVTDRAGGWIHSDWDDGFPITIPVPVPTLRAEEGMDRKPVFSGDGNEWAGQPAATIKVQRNGSPAPGVLDATVSGGRWSQTSTQAWVPGTYNIRAQQQFQGIASAWTSQISLVIKAPLPTVTVSPNGLTPRFSGTCLDTAQVNLGFPGETGRPHGANENTTNWTFTRAAAFEPGSYRVRVTQSIGGQTSNEASLGFDVPVLQPVITSPIGAEDVDHNPAITGTGGVSGAVMRVFDNLTDQLLGEVEVVDDRWSLDLKDQPFGLHAVYAIQQYKTLVSVKSEAAAFTVILFPPSIDNPKPGTRIGRTFRFDGCARPELNDQQARVELWLRDATEAFATVPVRFDGFWWHDAELPLGADTVRAKQFFSGHESLFTAERSYTVVPSEPLIESPAVGQEVGARLTISGHGYAGDQVEVAWEDEPEDVLGAAPVQANGTWSLELRIDKPAGSQSLVVRQECEGYRSDWSAPRRVQSLSKAPVFIAPQAGRWFTGPPRFEGTGDNGKSIELSYWFDPRRVVASGGVVAGGAWTASPDVPWAPGPHWMKARHGGTPGSEWGDSERFEMQPTPGDPDAA